MSGETKFSVLCSLFNWIQRSKSSAKKRSKFRKYLDTFCRPDDYFDSMRLILPSLDRERGSYGLKESVLATCLIDALGMGRQSHDANRLINWRKGGPKTGLNAGNFSLVATEVLQRRQGVISGELTIKELNHLLDQLASSENRAEKVSVLSNLIKKTNAQEMKWIVMIILKELKLGISEKSIFKEFHPDAEDLFNVTCDLRLVCERLNNRNQRHKRQDIEVGKAVRPQLASRVANAVTAWKKLHGKEVVVECKFDGDRIQIHKNGKEVNFYSRNFLDHSEYQHAMADVIEECVRSDRCILDGEMLVWDTSRNRFAEFGSNQEIARATKEGFDSDRQLCYVAFDILYVGDTSVIHRSLKERHELLQRFVNPSKGRLEILIPNGGLNDRRVSGEPCWSIIAHDTSDVERFFRETIDNRDEGVVLKDLGSNWEPSDRSSKWLKLKPDYVHPSSDLDVLIIGGYYGSGRWGGEVAQFLVGLADRPTPGTYPRKFLSFCRVGTGLSDEELDALVIKLKPYFKKYDYPKKAAPSFYHVTNNSKERPDVWIDSPEKSIIISITSDIRTIRSEVFAAPYSLRFPRIDRVRYDKPWHECLDVQSFVELVNSSNGTTQRGDLYVDVPASKQKRSSKERKRKGYAVPSHLVHTDITDVEEKTLIFSDMVVYFVNFPPSYSLDSIHKLVVEHGGEFSMNLNDSVTHSIAAESKGIKYQAAKRRGDVIHFSWILDCCAQNKLLLLQPKYFLFISDSTRQKLPEEIDSFSDSYFWDIDMIDLKQLLSNINRSEDSSVLDYYKKKYCPQDRWCLFNGYCIYCHPANDSMYAEWEDVLKIKMRRLNLEFAMAGGKISNDISHATHVIVLSMPDASVEFSSLLRSFPVRERAILTKRKLPVVKPQWLEDSLNMGHKLEEEAYSLRSQGSNDTDIQERQGNIIAEVTASSPSREAQPSDSDSVGGGGKSSNRRDTKRERGASKKTGAAKTQSRVHRASTRSSQAKIHHDGSTASSSDGHEMQNDMEEDDAKTHVRMEQGQLGGRRRTHRASHTQRFGSKRGSKIFEVNDSGPGQDMSDVDDREGTPASWPKIMTNEVDKKDFQKMEESDRREKKNSDVEAPIDPVQSMLLEMIPGLGRDPAGSSSTSIVDDNVREQHQPKKKKVSYRDMASELLKE